jgi:hypothetical protein
LFLPVVATGWLYLLRGVGVFDVGPHVTGALPLQQLAGDDDQPLVRLLLAWLPAGGLGSAALSGSRLPTWGRVAAISGVTAIVLLVTGAISDAAAISDPIPTHFAAQLTRPGTLVAVALVAFGASLSTARLERRPPDRAAPEPSEEEPR